MAPRDREEIEKKGDYTKWDRKKIYWYIYTSYKHTRYSIYLVQSISN